MSVFQWNTMELLSKYPEWNFSEKNKNKEMCFIFFTFCFYIRILSQGYWWLMSTNGLKESKALTSLEIRHFLKLWKNATTASHTWRFTSLWLSDLQSSPTEIIFFIHLALLFCNMNLFTQQYLPLLIEEWIFPSLFVHSVLFLHQCRARDCSRQKINGIGVISPGSYVMMSLWVMWAKFYRF